MARAVPAIKVPASKERRQAVAEYATALRMGRDEETIAACRERMRLANAEDYIRHIVDSAPPLSAETRARLAAILMPGGGER